MKIRVPILLPVLLLMADSPCSAESFAAAGPAAASPAQVASQAGVSPGGPWQDLLPNGRPSGFARIGENMTLCSDVHLRPDSRELSGEPGVGVIAALKALHSGDANNLLSKASFGDCEVSLEFLIGKGSNSGVKLQERYEVQLYDSHGKSKPAATDCGGVYPHWVVRKNGRGIRYIDKGIPPLENAAKPAGEWQSLQVLFQAPRFDSEGRKTANARFVSVKLNDHVVQQDVELESPTGNSSTPLPEVAAAPLYLQMDHGPVAFRKVRVRPLDYSARTTAVE
ncbi:MAG: DUF1080 domain-containing protein [Planctomycetales bacterium]|nr:DUF1080 domain-containing protein [Planctomycetales bacterium]